ncbi:MAG: DNA-directed RNA polymerase subunit omega [Lachnospiraceae bacterium]|nr:DNA-directed RNA polymerase subunit omega [Lachnospiraceae bacterium]
MIHPSYVELMQAVNKESEPDEPIVKSRYSIVTAAAKRARQLIDHADTKVQETEDRKPLSIAVEELNEGSVKILSAASAQALQEEMERAEQLAEEMRAAAANEEADTEEAEEASKEVTEEKDAEEAETTEEA